MSWHAAKSPKITEVKSEALGKPFLVQFDKKVNDVKLFSSIADDLNSLNFQRGVASLFQVII